MKNKREILWIITGTILTICAACNDYSVSEKQAESFLKYFPISTDNNQGDEVIQNINGGYVILSNYSSQDFSGSNRNIPIIFCDEFGRQGSNSPAWVGTSGVDKGNSIIAIDDGYIIAGSSSFPGRKEGLLMKLGTDGQLIWLKNYSGYQEMEFKQVIQRMNGNYLATGYITNSFGEQKIIFSDMATNGDLVWMTDPQGFNGFNDIGESIIEYQGRILVMGTTSQIGSFGGDRILLLNANSDGRGIISDWIPKIAGEQDMIGMRIIRDLSGQLYVLGNEINPQSRLSRVFIAKIQLSGGGNEYISVIDSTYFNYPGSIYAYDIKPVNGNMLAVCGEKSENNDFDIFFCKVDENLEMIQSKTFGAKGYQSVYGLSVMGDEGFALTGTAELGGGRISILLKLDNNAELN